MLSQGVCVLCQILLHITIKSRSKYLNELIKKFMYIYIYVYIHDFFYVCIYIYQMREKKKEYIDDLG